MDWLLLLLLPPPLREPVVQDNTVRAVMHKSGGRRRQRSRHLLTHLNPYSTSTGHTVLYIQLHLERQEHKHMKIPSSGPRRHTTSSCRCCTYMLRTSISIYSAAVGPLSCPLRLQGPRANDGALLPFGDTSVVHDAAGAVGARARARTRARARARAHVMITRTDAREGDARPGREHPAPPCIRRACWGADVQWE
jgi:hypothetical protein